MYEQQQRTDMDVDSIVEYDVQHRAPTSPKSSRAVRFVDENHGFGAQQQQQQQQTVDRQRKLNDFLKNLQTEIEAKQNLLRSLTQNQNNRTESVATENKILDTTADSNDSLNDMANLSSIRRAQRRSSDSSVMSPRSQLLSAKEKAQESMKKEIVKQATKVRELVLKAMEAEKLANHLKREVERESQELRRLQLIATHVESVSRDNTVLTTTTSGKTSKNGKHKANRRRKSTGVVDTSHAQRKDMPSVSDMIKSKQKNHYDDFSDENHPPPSESHSSVADEAKPTRRVKSMAVLPSVVKSNNKTTEDEQGDDISRPAIVHESVLEILLGQNFDKKLSKEEENFISKLEDNRLRRENQQASKQQTKPAAYKAPKNVSSTSESPSVSTSSLEDNGVYIIGDRGRYEIDDNDRKKCIVM